MFDISEFLLFSVHGGQDGHGGSMSDTLMNVLTYLESLSSKSATEIFTDFMPGMAALDNIHPLLVHFPIALLSLFVLIDIFGSLLNKQNWRNAASWFLYLGTLFAAATVAAGLVAADSVAHGETVHDIMEQHEHLGISVLATSAFLSAWRLLSRGIVSGGANVLYLLFATIMLILVSLTADLGGLMVYQYAVAVEQPSLSIDPLLHPHDHSHAH